MKTSSSGDGGDGGDGEGDEYCMDEFESIKIYDLS